MFKSANIKLANGKTLSIATNNPTKNKYIDKVILNAKGISSNFITYQQSMEGGTLNFILGSVPNKLQGTNDNSSPYLMTKGNVVSVPYTTKDLDLFIDEIYVDLSSATQGAKNLLYIGQKRSERKN